MKILSMEDAKKLAQYDRLVKDLEQADILIDKLEIYIKTLEEAVKRGTKND